MNKRRGLMLVICAPSGTGKSTLTNRLRKEFPRLAFSISCTTRAPRDGEANGVDYHFLDRDEFITRRDAGYFAEWAEVHGNFYGTPKQALTEMLEEGRDVLFDIDVQGAAQLRQSMGEGCHVFLFPPSFQTLKDRLLGRGTDADDIVRRRLDNAPGEINEAVHFDGWIINDDLDVAYDQLRAVYIAEGLRPIYRPTLPAEILGNTSKGD
ncbi:guanylate kinase [Desulfovibrio ferrophilus]|uniref:Guanylate kinase n=2 Tax=Desulfovibrio ferrophilus TaxID=241368 RepID=A0A2Z6AV97_9BACT|nr:guanylate kinase [Desulfovibrio ferrophilus]